MPRAASAPTPCSPYEDPRPASVSTAKRSSSWPNRRVKTQSVPMTSTSEPQAGANATSSDAVGSDITQSVFSTHGWDMSRTAILSMRNEASHTPTDAVSSRATRGNAPASLHDSSYSDEPQFWHGGEESLTMIGAFTGQAAGYVRVYLVTTALGRTIHILIGNSMVDTCSTLELKTLSSVSSRSCNGYRGL